MWLSKFVCVWSNINALSADSADHATSCYAHIPARCISLCHKNYARVARPSLRVLVMQYIQRCGGSGLVHETKLTMYSASEVQITPSTLDHVISHMWHRHEIITFLNMGSKKKHLTPPPNLCHTPQIKGQGWGYAACGQYQRRFDRVKRSAITLR